MADNQDVLSNEDLLALHQTYVHLQEAGDPRAEKLRTYLVASGKQALANPDANKTQFEQNGGQTGNERFADPTSESGVLGKAANFIRGGVNTITAPLLHPAETVKGMGAGMVAGGSTPYGTPLYAPTGNQQIDQQNEQTHRDAQNEAIASGADAIKNHPAYLTGQIAGPALLGEALKSPAVRAGVSDLAAPVVSKLPTTPPLKGALASRMAEVPAGETYSRGEVLNAARDNGINLDVAQATESPVAKGLKKANENSLASQSTYDANKTSNLAALDEWANNQQAKFSPESTSREVAGGQIQEALKNELAAKHQQSAELFKDLDSRLGTMPVDQSNLRTNASRIVSEFEPYYERHPELLPKQAWSILNDLANEPAKGSKQYSLSELHQLRSDLQDFYRNTPDMIKGKSQGWIQQMVSEIDQTMTNSEKAMKPLDVAEFRKANGIWQDIKGTYDNPQHPFYHAVRSQFPSQVPGMLSKGTPELASQVRTTLGSLEGPFQRQFVENLLNDKSGNLDLGRLNQRLKGVPQDHLEAMLGTDGAKQVRLLGQVAKRVIADNNPSGTGKVVTPAAEVGGLITAPLPTAAELAMQYGGAKLMNNPKVVDYLTKPKGRVTAPLPRGSRP